MEKNIISFNSAITTSVFALSFILIGLPLWWKTTEVYRYPVPYEECQGLLLEEVKHSVPVQLIIEDQNVQQGELWEELLNLSNEAQKSTDLLVSFDWSMSAIMEEEQELISLSQNSTDGASTLHLLDIASTKVISDKSSYGQLRILVLNKSHKMNSKFIIGKGRQGYVINDKNFKELAQDIVTLAKKLALVDRLQKLYTPASSYGGDKKPDKDRMRYLRSSKKFDITFSLIVPEPQALEVHWDIEGAVDEYLKEVLEEIELISTVKVKSQVLYMTSLPIPAQVSKNSGRDEFVVHSEHLPALINPIEAKLGSDTSVDPNLNFVLYIPTRDQTPLRIHNSKGSSLDSNAFLLPQWGGFMIYNCFIPENSTLPFPVTLDVREFMKVFLTQFRLLLGLPDKNEFLDGAVQFLPGPILHQWETDFLLRKNAQEQLSASISSLSSLSQLLQTIGNIVIRDDIGQKIHFALSSIKESLQLLSEGNLLDGYTKAHAAFLASDEAFFDPSLLALLYFPEDQKYAIYIPLFLPISIPVLGSLSQLWKYWQHRKRKAKSE